MQRIPLRRKDGTIRAHALVDDEDFDALNNRRWYLGTRGYAMRQVKLDGRNNAVFMHREILGLERGDLLESDHINHDKLDNRRANLRIVTRAENEQNKAGSIGQAGVRNVTWQKRKDGDGYWIARVVVNGKQHTRGRFATIEEAATAAAELRRLYHPFAPVP